MQPLSRHYMGFEEATEWIERHADRAHCIGHRRQRDRRALQRIALGLAVQRLVLTELLEHDHRQQARTRPRPRYRVEWRRRLADLFAVPAGELLPHGLDHFPLTRLRFKRARHVFAEFAQARASTAFARHRRINHHALTRKMVGERIALGALARKSAHVGRLGDRPFRREFVFRRARFQFFEHERQLIDQPRRAFRFLAVNLTLQFRNPQRLLRDQRRIFRSLRARHRQLCFQGGVFSGKNGASGIHETK
jgi:hypothetical protein